MKFKTILLSAAVPALLSACSDHSDKTRDGGFDSDGLASMQAGIWVDPNGCQHWIIDDGLEGYADARLYPDGRPVCYPVAPPNTAIGPFKNNEGIGDLL
jgi:hypothetical protein